jgi:hypothetical protein
MASRKPLRQTPVERNESSLLCLTVQNPVITDFVNAPFSRKKIQLFSLSPNSFLFSGYSLHLFKIRRACISITEWRPFEWLILMVCSKIINLWPWAMTEELM